MMRKRTVSVIGEGNISSDDPRFKMAERIGYLLIENGYRLMTGGLGGVMEAASKGARENPRHNDGDIIGILPGLEPEDANDHVDIVIPTGLGIARNHLVTNSDAVIAVGGGAGTLSEMAFAWQKGKLIIALKVKGWSGDLAGKRIDEKGARSGGGSEVVNEADSPEEALLILLKFLPS
jgi:uncharacterized protein (TIGR00725 family)